jgi:predicted lipoprotein with Yx(FWY)xxD motif
MRRSKVALMVMALALAGAGGGVAVANSTHSTRPAASPVALPALATPPGIRVATATVAGASEQILVDGRGLPLYTYLPDTAAQSRVSGALAQLWPPLLSSSGQQVQYHRHFLYTFVNDRPGQVTGQGVQNFFVATPQLGATSVAPTPAKSNPYGY